MKRPEGTKGTKGMKRPEGTKGTKGMKRPEGTTGNHSVQRASVVGTLGTGFGSLETLQT